MAKIHVSDEQRVEPDLTPMLDLVLDVLMFFIATTHFVKQERDHNDLPESTQVDTQAAVLGDADYLLVKFAQTPRTADSPDEAVMEVRFGFETKTVYHIRTLPAAAAAGRRKRQADKDLGVLRARLKTEFEDRQRNLRPGQKVETAIRIDAGGDCECGALWEFQNICKEVGFVNLQTLAYLKKDQS